MKSVIINGKTIKVKPIDFEGICDLEDLGFEISSFHAGAETHIYCQKQNNKGSFPSVI